MLTSIIFKVDSKTKEQLTKKAKKLNISLSEYMRLVIEGKISTVKKDNPLLALAGTLSDKEADAMFDSIKKDRRSRK